MLKRSTVRRAMLEALDRLGMPAVLDILARHQRGVVLNEKGEVVALPPKDDTALAAAALLTQAAVGKAPTVKRSMRAEIRRVEVVFRDELPADRREGDDQWPREGDR